LYCAGGHSYDLAKSGYVNLFPAHQRKSALPGDDAQMVRARRRFLDGEHYNPLRIELCKTVSACIESSSMAVVDLGCGEGYFTDALSSIAASVYGIDVSKAAIRAAAKRYGSLNLAVASTARLPLQDESFGVATVVLAPFPQTVFNMLSPGGFLIRITPGRLHLQEVKKLIYRESRQHERAPKEISGSCHMQEQAVTFDMTLDRSSLSDLISMTPMLYRTNNEQRSPADAINQLVVTASFWIDTFTKE